MNIVDPILHQCKLNPDAPAICAPGTTLHAISYGLMARSIYNVGRMARSLGLTAGTTVAILVQDKIFHATLILGLTRIGIVTVSARTASVPSELGIEVMISDVAGSFQNVSRVIQADLRWMMDSGEVDGGEPATHGDGDDVCRIMLTSGTTGEPKGIALSHDNLLGRIARYDYARGNRFPFCSRLYCELGLSTGPGFQYMLRMLSRGGLIVFFGEDPESTAQAFDLYKVQAMAVAPSGLAEWVKFFEGARVFQPGFDHVLTSGGLLPRPLSDRVRARVCVNLYCSYGSSETGTVCNGPAQLIEEVPGAVGFVTPEAAVEIVDDSGHVLPPNTEGIVRVRTPQIVARYVGDPERSEIAFRDGWFYPGDIGSLSVDRLLVILGRENSVLNIGGDKVSPEIVEETLLSFAGIEEAAVFVRESELGIGELVAAVVASAPVDEAGARAHCQQKLGRSFVPIYFVRVKSLPRNEMGKLDRRRLPGLMG